jgi:hypothetical protein
MCGWSCRAGWTGGAAGTLTPQLRGRDTVLEPSRAAGPVLSGTVGARAGVVAALMDLGSAHSCCDPWLTSAGMRCRKVPGRPTSQYERTV